MALSIWLMLFTCLMGLAFAKKVQIEVTVPRYYTPLFDEVFISGTFNNWALKDPNYRLTKETMLSRVFTIMFDMPFGKNEFKFNRGTWETGEKRADLSDLPANRVITILDNNDDVLKQSYVVENWADMKAGVSTASPNAYMMNSRFEIIQFQSTKTVWIYLPEDYYEASAADKRYPVLYMQDGQNVFDKLYSAFGKEWEVDKTLDKFFKLDKEVPIVIAPVTDENRRTELTPFKNANGEGGRGDDYLDFIVNELKPFIDAAYRTKADRHHTAIGGASLGGLFSFYAGLKMQDKFSRVISLSPAFFFSPKEMFAFANQTEINYKDFKIYFSCGDKEDRYPTMVQDMNEMVEILKKKNFKNMRSSVVENGEHDENMWKNEFEKAYDFLF